MSGVDTDPNNYIALCLGAARVIVQKRFALYIPDKDRHGNAIDADVWIRRAMQFFDRINGGATALPAALGIWRGNTEHTVVVYSHMEAETFDHNKYIIRAFLHAFGRTAEQGEVMCEFGSAAFFITDYDKPGPIVT